MQPASANRSPGAPIKQLDRGIARVGAAQEQVSTLGNSMPCPVACPWADVGLGRTEWSLALRPIKPSVRTGSVQMFSYCLSSRPTVRFLARERNHAVLRNRAKRHGGLVSPSGVLADRARRGGESGPRAPGIWRLDRASLPPISHIRSCLAGSASIRI